MTDNVYYITGVTDSWRPEITAILLAEDKAAEKQKIWNEIKAVEKEMLGLRKEMDELYKVKNSKGWTDDIQVRELEILSKNVQFEQKLKKLYEKYAQITSKDNASVYGRVRGVKVGETISKEEWMKRFRN